MKLASIVDFLFVEGEVIMACRRPDGIVVGGEGLNDYMTAQRPSPGSAGHLAQELESPLPGAEVR